jgi:hypothetical protein
MDWIGAQIHDTPSLSANDPMHRVPGCQVWEEVDLFSLKLERVAADGSWIGKQDASAPPCR